MCSPAARTASQSAPRSAGKGVFPLPRVDHRPGQTQPGGWRARGKRETARHAGLSRVLGAQPGRGRRGVCRGFLVTGWGKGLQRTPKVPLGRKSQLYTPAGPRELGTPTPCPCAPSTVPNWGWGGGGEAPEGVSDGPPDSPPWEAGFHGLHARARLPLLPWSGGTASLSFPTGSPWAGAPSPEDGCPSGSPSHTAPFS